MSCFVNTFSNSPFLIEDDECSGGAPDNCASKFNNNLQILAEAMVLFDHTVQAGAITRIGHEGLNRWQKGRLNKTPKTNKI